MSSAACGFLLRAHSPMRLSLEWVEVIALDEGSNIDFSISVITRLYCNLSEGEYTSLMRRTRGEVSFWIVSPLIQSWIAKQGFFSFASITRKQEREQLACWILLLPRWTCLEDEDNLSTQTIWSATIQHIVSLVVIIAHRRVFNTCRGKRQAWESSFDLMHRYGQLRPEAFI